MCLNLPQNESTLFTTTSTTALLPTYIIWQRLKIHNFSYRALRPK